MSTAYFTRNDYEATASLPSRDAQPVYDKLGELHRTLYRRMRDNNYDLHPHWNKNRLISSYSGASNGEIKGLSLPYLRARERGILESNRWPSRIVFKYPLQTLFDKSAQRHAPSLHKRAYPLH